MNYIFHIKDLLMHSGLNVLCSYFDYWDHRIGQSLLILNFVVLLVHGNSLIYFLTSRAFLTSLLLFHHGYPNLAEADYSPM